MPVQIQNDWGNEAGPCLRIGLVNNMPEAAFAATEQQFFSLLQRASSGIPVSLSLYVLPELPTPDPGYRSTEALTATRLDGLVVTGREPLKSDLREESFWNSFTILLEWAKKNTLSTVWSCLAAHAAVLHMDDIVRQRRSEKHFGVFDCTHASCHFLTAGMPYRSRVPHSRWNALSEVELAARGYVVLLRSEGEELDTFIKMGESLFVFLQGHPEYQTDTLLREYRRDVGRCVRDLSIGLPTIPRGYFSSSTEQRLTGLRSKAELGRSEALLTEVTDVLREAAVENTWAPSSLCLYRNWLEYLIEKKSEPKWNYEASGPVDLSNVMAGQHLQKEFLDGQYRSSSAFQRSRGLPPSARSADQQSLSAERLRQDLRNDQSIDWRADLPGLGGRHF